MKKPQTITEKIFSNKDSKYVYAGNIIDVDIDMIIRSN